MTDEELKAKYPGTEITIEGQASGVRHVNVVRGQDHRMWAMRDTPADRDHVYRSADRWLERITRMEARREEVMARRAARV